MSSWRNWGRAEIASPAAVVVPESIEDLVRVIRDARDRGMTVKAVGAGHSFTAIAATDGIMVSLDRMRGLISVDRVTSRVRLRGGTYLHEVPALLAPHRLALQNMGDIDRQTITGAISTGTHGTGRTFSGLAAQIVGATLVTADGTVLTVDEHTRPELLPAVRLGLGALGILADVTVQCVPEFLLEAHQSSAELDDVLDHLDEYATADHFEFYWWPGTTTVQTKSNTRLPGDSDHTPPGRIARFVDQRIVQNELLRGVCALGAAVPAVTPAVNRMATRVLTEKRYVDRSFRVFTSPRTVRFNECEYAIPLTALPEAVRALRALIDRQRISFPVEVRTAAADDLWLSTAFGRASGYIAVHRYWREDHLPYFRAVDALMRRFQGRPHWGKVHFQDAQSLAEVYPRFDDFRAVRDQLDPDRVFGNPYLHRVLGD